jgi:hypothetical protein
MVNKPKTTAISEMDQSQNPRCGFEAIKGCSPPRVVQDCIASDVLLER